MDFLTENYKHELALAPQSLTGGTAVTGTYFSASEAIKEIVFRVSHAAITDGKKLTVEIMNADNSSGIGAKSILSVVKTASTAVGTTTAGVVEVRLTLDGSYSEFFAVKVLTDNATLVASGDAQYPVKYSV